MDEPVWSTVSGEESPGKLSLYLVETIAEARGTSADDLDLCLHEYVDVSALTALFESGLTAPTRRGSVTFSVEEVLVTVTVESDDRVEIRAESTPAGATGSPERGRS
ncbi:HalOD1 output domain-containing protein [Halobium salinum]|uniref:HalOD1 output domain-containing protein n=1 Tax=Halobium salinum TaxID=1364940 RepID=A0ABD5P670_9EURY|nr:HalOD1 output domain-containing protein [Halobium salinum]